jgi:hypothetical protein
MVTRLATRKRKVIEGGQLWIAGGLSLLAAAVFLSVFSTRGEAAFPGTPGKISFDSTRDGNTEIYVMNADGSQPTTLSPPLSRM